MSIEHEQNTMVARQDGVVTFGVGRPLATEINIRYYGPLLENLLMIHKRPKTEYMSLEHVPIGNLN